MKLVTVGDVDKVFQYLRKNDISKVLNSVETKSKRSPLHIACKHGHLALVEYFLERGAEVDARDRLLKTPLHYACEAGFTTIVQTLMDNKHRNADPFEADCNGRTAMHYAVYSGQT